MGACQLAGPRWCCDGRGGSVCVCLYPVHMWVRVGDWDGGLGSAGWHGASPRAAAAAAGSAIAGNAAAGMQPRQSHLKMASIHTAGISAHR